LEELMRSIVRVWAVAALALAAVLRPEVSMAQTAPKEADKAWPFIAGLPPEQRQAVIEREANREGSIVIYGALGIDRAKFLVDEFNRVYPKIKVEFVRLTANDLLTKLTAEHRAHRMNADLVITTTSYMDLLKDTLAPYQQRSWADWDSRFLFGSAAKGWTGVVYELLPTTIAWRTDRGITRKTAPKTLVEMEDPKWRGRAGATTQLEEFIDSMFVTYGEAAGMEQVKRLAALDNKLIATNAALADMLGSGEVDLTWNFVAHRAYFLQKKGAPIDWVFMDPQFAQGVTISITRLTSRPYAAAAFMDHLLEAETLEKLDRLEAGRIFGNTKGKYAIALDQFPKMLIYRSLPKEEFARLNGIVQELFIRREKN
jgi:iron(III) transport system substrate-binding protein